MFRYLTHPQVNIDPSIPVPEWGLSPVGAARVAAIAECAALQNTRRIICSNETKAIETAMPLAQACGLTPEIWPETHENDRSATGFLPAAEFETTADSFFARPDESTRGWETARDAQKRIIGAVDRLLQIGSHGDILMVGHGAVGTLLYSTLSGQQIDRRYDQGPGGGGNYFACDMANMTPLHHWRPMERLVVRAP